MTGAAPIRPRVAVVITRLGIPSEVWAVRQAQAFKHIDPVFVAWDVDPAGAPPQGFEHHLIDAPFAPPDTLPRKLQRKLGHPGALALTGDQQRAIAQVLAETKAQAVLCHFAWTALAIAQAAPASLPLIWHVHGRDVSARLTDKSYCAMLTRYLPEAAALIAVGQHQIARLTPFGLPPRTALIPCGAPLDQFAKTPLPDQRLDGPLRFVSVGRMSHEKGMAETLAAFERIAPDFPNAALTLIGGGPILDMLKTRAAAGPAAGRVTFPGMLPPDRVAAELASAQIYLQHSQEVDGWVEGFGVTLTEAGATGLPLLASASGGLVDQIEEGQNGYLFPPGDVARQAELMAQLARDPGLRAALGSEARRLAARFDSTGQAARLESEILATLGQSGTDTAA